MAVGPVPDRQPPYGGRRLLTLRCDPQLAELLRAEFPAILPGFYTDKRTWISVDLDGGVPEDVLRDLCAAAHRIVFSKLPRYRRRELAPQAEETMAQPPVPRG